MGALILHTVSFTCTPSQPWSSNLRAMGPIHSHGSGESPWLAEEGMHCRTPPWKANRGALVNGGNQRRPGLTVRGVEEGFLEEEYSELDLRDDGGEMPGGEP